MKKRHLFIPIILGSAIVGMTTALLVGLSSNGSNNIGVIHANYEGEVANPFQKTVYFLDETIEIGPKNVIYNDTQHVCTNFYFIYPDGSQKTGTKHRLNQVGEYKIVFIAQDGDKVIEATESIYAYKKAYSVKKEASTSEFVDSIICNQKDPSSGIQTYLAEGDEWTYNNAIDISNASLEQPIIKYYTRQSSELCEHVSLDVETTILRLTDFYDSNNYIDISIRYNDTNPSTHRKQPYVLAGCYGQALSGLDLTNRSSRTVSYNGQVYYLHNSNRAWGACLDTVPGRIGINGTEYSPDIANTDNRGFSVYYNNSDKTIYVKHNGMHFVTDLDEPAIYSNNLFKGFTTGEVILSMRCETYTESLGFFEIDEIYGKKGDELNSAYAIDDRAPIISLSNESTGFYISTNEPFNLFTATARDPNIVDGITTQVYYDYGKENQRYIPIVDGAFTPKDVGKYTVVYSAKDTYGNIATRTVECNAITTENNEIVHLDFAKPEDCSAGTSININKPSITSYNEGVYSKVKIFNKDKSDLKVLSDEDDSFFLSRVGEYTIEIEYGDVATKFIKEFSFKSLPSDNVYLQSTTLPKYLIKSTAYTLNDNHLILCDTEEKHFVDADIFVKVDDNANYESEKIDPNNFFVSATKSVQFKYSYNSVDIFESEVIPVVDVGYDSTLDFTKYFAGDFDGVLTADGIEFTTKNSSGESNLEFINPIALDLFKLNFEIIDNLNVSSCDLILKDHLNVADDIVLSFSFSGNVLYLTYDGIKTEIGNTKSINVSYNADRHEMSFGTSFTLQIEDNFADNFVYINLRLNTISTSSILVSQINNQTFNTYSDTVDTIAPQIAYNRLKGQRKINELITIKSSICCDVLSPYLVSNHKLQVYYRVDTTSPTSYITATDGTLLNGSENPNVDYDVLLDKHGIYVISYNYTDQYGKKFQINETIYVSDNENPEISINGATSTTVDVITLGSEIKIKDYTVTDESEVNVSIFAVSPMNMLYRIEGNTFKPDMKGDWQIIYFAEDAYGNVSSTSYIVRVK